MGEYKNQILRDAKILLKKDTCDDDEVLSLLIENCIVSVLAYCRLELLPYQLIGFVTNMTVKRYNEMYSANNGGGNIVKSITEGDRKIDFSVPEKKSFEYDTEILKPFINRRGRLTSEACGE